MSSGKSNEKELSWLISAGVVGADIGTSVFYSTGILFPIVGYMAPAFVLFACLVMWIFKRTYEEGLAMSPYNGGAYSMILRTLGRQSSAIAGALTFVSYLATAAVSSLSGSYYLYSLFSSQPSLEHIVLISFIPIIFFGALNIKGIKEPAKLVTAIAIFHFAFLIIIEFWAVFYMIFNWSEIDLAKFSSFIRSGTLSFPLIVYGIATAFLGITGFESAAQIIENMRKPQIRTLEKLYRAVILGVSFTAPLISFFCLAILTPEETQDNMHNLLSMFTQKIGGVSLKSILVLDASLTLFAATNTALVGFVGLATTMAKHGNLPQTFLKRVYDQYPSLEGYPFIVIPFALTVMGISILIAGSVDQVAKVYAIAFLGVMVSFALGVILMRNKNVRRSAPKQYLSKTYLKVKDTIIPLPPLFTGGILSIALIILFANVNAETLFTFTFLLAITILLMAFYRWGVLEERLVSHHDLRLGLGHFATQPMSDLPHDLKTFILCIGSTKIRRLIVSTIKEIQRNHKGPFELILFYAEDEDVESSKLFYELLQRVVSQQIAPIVKKDIILTVKILPGTLLEGLNTLKTSIPFKSLYFGVGHDPDHSFELKDKISKELEVSIISVY